MTTDQILPSGWRFVRGSTASGELHPSAGGIGRVLAHTRNSARARWGVWNVGTSEETLGLLDEAIERIQDGVPGLITRERQVTEVERRGGAVSAAEYRVPMNKPVGTLGGSEGDGRALEHVAVLVTREASGAVNITTAYPIEPPAASARDRRVDPFADAALDDDRDPPRGLFGRGAPAPSNVRYRGTRAARTTRNGWQYLAARSPDADDPDTVAHPGEGAIERVLAHRSDSNRADWGVWGSAGAQLSDDRIFALIDEAVDAIAAQSPAATPAGMWPADAAGRANGISAKISYTVHMGRSVGTAGGSRGRGKALTAIKVSLLAHDDGTVSILTAYPVRGDGADVSHEDTVLNGRAP